MTISAQGLGYVFTAKDLASGPIKHLTANVQKLAVTSESTQRAYQGMVVSGRRLLVAGGLGLLAINSLTKSYGKFEHRLISAGTVMNATATQMEDLEKAAIGAGIATQFSPEEAAQGLENLGAAGMDAATAIKTLNPVLDLAAASLGQLGVGEAAANVVGVLNAFGDSADFATKRVDQLVKITQMSNFQARDFSVAISQAAAQASSADQTFESMTATLGLLRNTNMDASSAATAYREAIRRVAGDTRALRKLRALGITTLDKETGKIKDIGRIMAEVIPKMAKLNAQQRNLNLKVIFGVRGMKTYNGFLASYRKNVKEGKVEVGDFAGAHRKLVEGLENAGGAAARTRDKLLATAEGRRILLKGSMETFKVVAGKALVPALIPALKNMTGALNTIIKVFSLIPDEVRGFISHFAGAGATLLIFAGIVKMAAGVRGLMALDRGMDSAAIATERFERKQKLANTQLVRGMGIRKQAAVASAKMGSAIAGSLPLIGLGVSAFMGLSVMFDARRAKERKRVKEVRSEQERMRNQFAQTSAAVEKIGVSAQRATNKLIKMSRTRDLLQVQHVLRTNIARAAAADAQIQRTSLSIDTDSMSKKQKAAKKAQLVKLRLELLTARKLIEINKLAELDIRANRFKRRGVRTEKARQIIVASSLQKIKRMRVSEEKTSRSLGLAIKAGDQEESVKALRKRLKRMRKIREREELRAGRRAGFRGKGLKGARRVAAAFAEPVLAGVKATGDPTAATGLDDITLQNLFEGRQSIPRIMKTLNPRQQAALRKLMKERNEATGGQLIQKQQRGPEPTAAAGGRGAKSLFTEFSEDIGLGTPRAPSWWPSAETSLSASIAKAMKGVKLEVSIEGERIPTQKKNQNERTASGKPSNPSS